MANFNPQEISVDIQPSTKFSEYREIDEAGDKGLLTQEGVDYLEKNQNYALSTVLLIFNQEAKFAKGGIQKYGHQEASVLKNIFDKGFINSDDSEKITLINMIVQGHLGESLFSEEEVRQYEQIKKTVMSDKDGFYYHFSLVDKYNEKYPFLKWL